MWVRVVMDDKERESIRVNVIGKSKIEIRRDQRDQLQCRYEIGIY